MRINLISRQHNELIVVSGVIHAQITLLPKDVEFLNSQCLPTTHLNISWSDGTRDATTEGKLQGIRGYRSRNITVPLECKYFHLINFVHSLKMHFVH